MTHTQECIAVIGARGFVGRAICHELRKREGLSLVEVYRGDDISTMTRQADVLIHTANPARRYYAEKHPREDFVESVEKTHHICSLASGKKLILISSISSRTQLDTVYGRNRRACECIVEDGQSLIIRLGPMFGEEKQVGPLHDMLENRPVYVSGQTEYAYVNVEYNARKILDFRQRCGIIEIGAKNTITLEHLRGLLGSISTFAGADDTQIPMDPPPDAPDVREVISFALSLHKSSRE
jgi:nucleoside-diphosphate-sugar epimerase